MKRLRTRTPELTLADLDFRARFALLTRWRPPADAWEETRSQWRTWAEFLNDYESVRDEFLAEHPQLHDGRAPFAERARVYAEQHGIARLEALVSYADVSTL